MSSNAGGDNDFMIDRLKRAHSASLLFPEFQRSAKVWAVRGGDVVKSASDVKGRFVPLCALASVEGGEDAI